MGISDSIKRFTDDFFDNLAAGATNRAFDKAKKRNDEDERARRVVKHINHIDEAAKEIEQILKELE